jgi:hypothetical protein
MLKFLTLISIVLAATATRSQNIYTALHLNEEREYKVGRPKNITEIKIFYAKDGKTTEKSIKVFDDAGMILTEDRFGGDGALTARLSYTNDTTRRLKLTRTFERWGKYGHNREIAYYSYDSNNYLIRTTDKDGNGSVFQRSEIVNNEKGDPIELSGYNANGELIGKELASYFYGINKAVTSVQNDARILSTDTIKINFIAAHLYPAANETYNEKGDLTNWVSKNLDGTETLYEEQYMYDAIGNSIEETIYKVVVTPKGNRKKELDRVFKRAYTY